MTNIVRIVVVEYKTVIHGYIDIYVIYKPSDPWQHACFACGLQPGPSDL